MSIEIKSPTFPESVAEGTVANWLKHEGENVSQDEVLAEIETDKVVLEVLAPENGILSKIIKKEGEVVLSAEKIADFEEISELSEVHEEEKASKVEEKSVESKSKISEVKINKT